MLTAHEVIHLTPDQIRGALARMSPTQIQGILNKWRFWARPSQLPPEGDWTTWLFLGGRGTGKTRSGAEWVKEVALAHPGIRMALIAPTKADVRDTMIHGVSGIASLDWENGTRPRHIASKRLLIWPNGAQAITYSAEEPDRLRGPNFHVAWCDELAAWRYMQETWDMLQFGMRLHYPGYSTPRTYISTTPRPVPIIRDLVKKQRDGDDSVAITVGTTYQNRANLSDKFFASTIAKYEGSRLGRQELLGELLEDLEGALWTHSMIPHILPADLPPLVSVVVAVDPATSDKATANECGIVGCALGEDGRGYVLGDFSTHGQNPSVWGAKIVHAVKLLNASYVLAEGNLAGGLVETVLRQISPNIPLKLVQAQKGKYMRAEPVSMLYEQGKVSHVGQFAALEDQMCRMTANYQKENPGQSPDRVDALVWGIQGLMLESLYDYSMRWAAG
jgi:phage terminase large subunit-like protein